MKALYIYNIHSAQEVELVQRALEEMGSYIEAVPIHEVPDMVKQLVRATPALITADDHLQGDELLADGVDGKLLITAKLYQRLEEDELNIHQQKTHRLDNLIKAEIKPVKDQADLLGKELVRVKLLAKKAGVEV